MVRFLVLLLILFTFLVNLRLKAVQPVVEVPELPKNLRNFVTNEEKYFDLLIDYYLRAKLLESQLNIKTVPQISYSYVQNQDLKVLKDYYNLANELRNKVLVLPENPRILNLQEILNNLYKENEMLKIENDSLKYENSFLLANGKLLEIKDSLIKKLTKEIVATEEKYTKEIIKFLNKSKPVPLLSADINALYWFYGNDRIKTYLAPSFDLDFNFMSIAGGALNLMFSTSYLYLTNIVEFPGTDFLPRKNTYKDDIWDFDLKFEINLSKLLNSNSIYWGIGLGAGYFIGFTKSPLPFIFQNDYRGFSLHFQTNVGGFNKRIPIGIVLGASFYKYIDEIGYERLGLGKPFVPSVYAGIKFSLLNSL